MGAGSSGDSAAAAAPARPAAASRELWRASMPPLHGRRAQLPVSPRPPVSWAPENTAGDEAYPHAPLAPQPPLHGRRGVVRSGMRRSHRDIAGTLGRPMFTLRTEVNLHNPLIPRPYKQNTVQPSAMPLSDTIVLAVRPNSPLRLPTASERASEPAAPFAPARCSRRRCLCGQNLEKRIPRVAPPVGVQKALQSWNAVWYTPRVRERQVRCPSARMFSRPAVPPLA